MFAFGRTKCNFVQNLCMWDLFLSGIMNDLWLVTRNESLQSVEEKIMRHTRDGTNASR